METKVEIIVYKFLIQLNPLLVFQVPFPFPYEPSHFELDAQPSILASLYHWKEIPLANSQFNLGLPSLALQLPQFPP